MLPGLMRKNSLLTVFLTAAIIYHCNAQNNNKKWSPTIAVNFTSIPVSYGSDTTYNNALVVDPNISYRSNGGFGVTYSPYFVLGGSQPGIFMHKVDVGLEQYGKPKFDIVAEYTHYFFTGNSSIPLTPITNQILFSGTYKKSLIRPVISAGLGFGKDTGTSSGSTAIEIAFAAGINHPFTFNFNNYKLTFTPSVLLDGGTNEYFSFLNISKYITHSKNFKNVISAAKAKGRSRGQTNNKNATDVAPIELSNLELNLEGSLDIGSFNIRPVGSLFIPFQTAYWKNLDGYWEITLSYYF